MNTIIKTQDRTEHDRMRRDNWSVEESRLRVSVLFCPVQLLSLTATALTESDFKVGAFVSSIYLIRK